jgi:hypothetical protein
MRWKPWSATHFMVSPPRIQRPRTPVLLFGQHSRSPQWRDEIEGKW